MYSYGHTSQDLNKGGKAEEDEEGLGYKRRPAGSCSPKQEEIEEEDGVSSPLHFRGCKLYPGMKMSFA